MTKVHVGCCGFSVARQRYFSTFDAVEIQQTFYQLPQIETAERWREEAPEGFLYAVKAWQLITHEPKSPTYRRLRMKLSPTKRKNYGAFKPTDEVFDAWEATRLFAQKLGAKMVLFQCPASFTPEAPNKKNMVRFFRSLDRSGLAFVWEPRGGWQDEEVRELCEELDLVHCVDPLKSQATYGYFRYYRLHGPQGARSRYEEPALRKILELCRGRVYCFFNNTYMFEDAVKFLRLISGAEA